MRGSANYYQGDQCLIIHSHWEEIFSNNTKQPNSRGMKINIFKGSIVIAATLIVKRGKKD